MKSTRPWGKGKGGNTVLALLLLFSAACLIPAAAFIRSPGSLLAAPGAHAPGCFTHRLATGRKAIARPLHRHLRVPLRVRCAEDAPASGGSKSEADLKKGLDKEFLTIALPAFVQFAAEPLASLVDTMYLGRLGAAALGGAGVAISAQYVVAKLYNDPLLRTSISLVASSNTASDQVTPNSTHALELAHKHLQCDLPISDKEWPQEGGEERRQDELSKAVSSALLLAAVVGAVQALVYSVACEPIVRGMGVTVASDMYKPAVSYLQIRALGTPGATLWLVVNGVFRGLGDTTTPLKWALVFTGLNAILDPIFIFTFGMGCSGAAAGTAVSQYVALVPLLLLLQKRVGLQGDLNSLKESLKTYLTSGGLMLVRTVGKITVYTVCAREAALLGTIFAAAYNITFQLGTATTQICESFAVAAQALLARELNGKDHERRRVTAVHIIKRAVLAGGIVSAALSLLTWFQQGSVLKGLSSDPKVVAAAASIMPIVLATQVSKGLAYPVNGVIMGGLDWGFLTVSMWLCNAACCSVVFYFKPQQSILTIWIGLFTFMSAQCITGLLRIVSKTGVWRALGSQK